MIKLNDVYVDTAAKAIALAQFARFGFDIFISLEGDQIEHNLMIVEGERALKIAVKGSQNGRWGLAQTQQLSRSTKSDYHFAAESWSLRFRPMTALCLVRFHGVSEDELPRAYLAWPREVADRMKQASGGRGDTMLWEDHIRETKEAGAGSRETLPPMWRLTRGRADQMLRTGQ